MLKKIIFTLSVLFCLQIYPEVTEAQKMFFMRRFAAFPRGSARADEMVAGLEEVVQCLKEQSDTCKALKLYNDFILITVTLEIPIEVLLSHYKNKNSAKAE